MAHVLLTFFQKSRWLVLLLLVMILLNNPLLSTADTKSASAPQIIEVSDTIAGLSNEVSLKSQSAFEAVEVLISTPSGEQVILESITDDFGNAEAYISERHLTRAGEYWAQARSLENDYGDVHSFEVYTTGVSKQKSESKLEKDKAKLEETISLKVTLMDDYLNPIQGHIVKVIPEEESVSVYAPKIATNKMGEIEFYIYGEEEGQFELNIFDTSSSTNLDSLEFNVGKAGHKAIGGNESYWLDGPIILAAESGPVDAFELTGIPSSISSSSSQNVNVRAIDAAGTTVTDYTGTIRFASSDPGATLPNDYTYRADDLGEHEFSLGVKFVTLGEQSLSAIDIDALAIVGEIEFTVSSGAGGGGNGPTSDGDFSLISPASGTYSTNNINVIGEADYGYIAVVYLGGEEVASQEIDFDDSFDIILEDLNDGDYELYVEILDDLEVIETSDTEEITIDTDAPELTSVSADPSEGLLGGELVRITVLTETGLADAVILFEGQLYTLEEDAVTAGKYQAELLLPVDEGTYSLDVILTDELGNEVQYRDQLSLNVGDQIQIDPEVGQSTGLTAVGVERGVLLSWESVESDRAIAFYRVYYGPSPTSLFATSDSFDSSTSWTVFELYGGQPHYFSISAVDIEGNEGPQSNAILGTPLLAPGETAGEFRPELGNAAIITQVQAPPEVPESGAGSLALISISLIGALGLTRIRRRRA